MLVAFLRSRHWDDLCLLGIIFPPIEDLAVAGLGKCDGWTSLLLQERPVFWKDLSWPNLCFINRARLHKHPGFYIYMAVSVDVSYQSGEEQQKVASCLMLLVHRPRDLYIPILALHSTVFLSAGWNQKSWGTRTLQDLCRRDICMSPPIFWLMKDEPL